MDKAKVERDGEWRMKDGDIILLRMTNANDHND